jgi:serine/threonine protein kinase
MALKVGEEPVPGYRLVKFLGRGGFGQVWQAASPGGIHVALKIIDLGGREGLKEFKALRLMKSIRQANLTPILAFWLKDEDGFLVDESQVGGDLTQGGQPNVSATPTQGTVVMGSLSKMRPSELIIAMGLGDKTLSDRLRECQQQNMEGIPPEELFDYMFDAARAIDFLNTPRHDLGHGPVSTIQHCDIKPQNILIVGDTAQVCDFGLARELGANVKMTSAAVSPAYGAPELIEGQPPSGATDQYSLAITYVELRTGSLPFSDPDSYLHVVNAHLQSALELSYLSPEEQEIIRKATMRDPGQRFESALKMVKALRQACPEEFGSRRSMGPPRDRRSSSQTGSDMESTVPLPGAPATYADPADARRMGYLSPFPTTETPSVRGLVTKVDPRSVASTQALSTDEALQAPRRMGFVKRLAISAAVVVALVGLGVVGWNLIPEEPEVVARTSANRALRKAAHESDSFEQAKLFNSAIDQCQPFSSNNEFAEIIDEARTGLAQVEAVVNKHAESDLQKIDALPDNASRLQPLQNLVDYCVRFATVLPDSAELAANRSRAESWRDQIEREQRLADEDEARRLVDKCEQILDNESQVPGDLLRDLERSQKLIGQSQENADVAFRARLSTARAAARDGRLASDKQLEDLWNEGQRLPEFKAKQRAPLSVLRALNVKQGNVADPLPALQLLTAVPQLRQSLEKCKWENEQLEALLDWAEKAVNPEDRSAIFTSYLRQLRAPVDVAELRAQADAQWKDGKLDELAKTLDEAKRASPTGRDAANFHELELLLKLAKDASTEEQTTEALDELDKLLSTDDVTRLDDLSATLAKLSQSKPRLLARTIKTADSALQRASGEGLKNQIAATLKSLYPLRIAQYIVEPSSEDSGYFKRLHELCTAARNIGVHDPLVELALVESVASGGTPAEVEANTRGMLRGEVKVNTEHQLYEKYVRLLREQKVNGLKQLNELGDTVANLDRLADTAETSSAPFTSKVKERREALADLLLAGARQLRKNVSDEATVPAILHPYGDDAKKAAQALKWTTIAIKMLPTEKRDEQVFAAWALATWHKSRNSTSESRESAASAVRKYFPQWKEKSLSPNLKWPAQYASAMSLENSAAGNLEAARLGANLVENVLKAHEKPLDDQVVELHSQLIEPSIRRAAKVAERDGKTRSDLAPLWYYKCNVIRQYPEASWPFDNHLSEAHEAIKTALGFDPGNPKYLAERGNVLVSLQRLDLAAADAKAAIAKDANLFEGHALQGKVLLQKARVERNRARVAELLKQSVSANETALKLANDKSDQFLCLLDLGTSYTEWANYVDPKERSPQELLDKAIESVHRAQKIDDTSWSDYAFTRLGNAYEDLAWRAKVSVNDNYEAAIEEFSKAISKRRDLPGPWRDLGRCYFKREAESGQVDHGYMDIAFKNLSEAVRLGEKNPSAHYWLGRVYLYQASQAVKKENYKEASEKCAKADESFAKAKDLAEKGTSDAATYTLAWVGARLDDASPNAKSQIRGQVDKLLKTESALEDKNYRNQLYLLRAKSYEREGDVFNRQAGKLQDRNAKAARIAQRNPLWDKAITVYNDALGPDLTKTDLIDLVLLKERTRLRLDWAKDASMRQAAVEDANQIVELMGDSADADAFELASQAYFGLGNLPAADKDKTGALLLRAVECFEKMIAKTPDDQRSLEMYEGFAYAIKVMLANDRRQVPTWKPKAQKSIERALQMQAPPQKKSELRQRRIEIEAL